MKYRVYKVHFAWALFILPILGAYLGVGTYQGHYIVH